MALKELIFRANVLTQMKQSIDIASNAYTEGLAELYTQFLKENGLDGPVRRKGGFNIGYALFVKVWNDNNVEICCRSLGNPDMDVFYPAYSGRSKDPISIMMQLLDDYIPYTEDTGGDQNEKE